jgi:uncharacterized SAM-binding protein YcdF (DUF218 family)
MFFVLSKIIGFFATPSNLPMLVGLLGLALLLTRRKRLGRFLLIAGVLAVAVAGWSPLGNALLLPLEQRFPPWNAGQGAPDGIVVLGGAVSPVISAARGEPALNESAERMTAVAALARQYPRARIIFSGGSGSLFPGEPHEADYVAPLWESFGIPRQRVLFERQARNTAENARFTKELAHPRAGEHWLLITSAYHMPRAIGAFRRAGFAVEAYPVDWRTRGEVDLFAPFATLAGGLARTDTAAHEWIGLLAYWLTGRTSALFPAP